MRYSVGSGLAPPISLAVRGTQAEFELVYFVIVEHACFRDAGHCNNLLVFNFWSPFLSTSLQVSACRLVDGWTRF